MGGRLEVHRIAFNFPVSVLDNNKQNFDGILCYYVCRKPDENLHIFKKTSSKKFICFDKCY